MYQFGQSTIGGKKSSKKKPAGGSSARTFGSLTRNQSSASPSSRSYDFAATTSPSGRSYTFSATSSPSGRSYDFAGPKPTISGGTKNYNFANTSANTNMHQVSPHIPLGQRSNKGQQQTGQSRFVKTPRHRGDETPNGQPPKKARSGTTLARADENLGMKSPARLPNHLRNTKSELPPITPARTETSKLSEKGISPAHSRSALAPVHPNVDTTEMKNREEESEQKHQEFVQRTSKQLDDQGDTMRQMNLDISKQQFRIIKMCNPVNNEMLDAMLEQHGL